ncbi:MAG: ATP-binding protein, partial [Bacteroidota bacterium]
EGLIGPWFTDVRLFQRLMDELLSNAFRFAHPDRPLKLKVSLERKQETYHFVIADNGIGIPSEGQNHLFDLFRPLRSRGEYPIQGLGCGLAFARRIAERLGGSIFHQKGKKMGAAFEIRLPFQIAPPSNFLPEKFLYPASSDR